MRVYHSGRALVAAAMPGTRVEIMAKTGLSRGTVDRWINTMREEGASRIISWQRPVGTGPFMPVHQFGSGKDRPCQLLPLSRSKKWKKYTASLKAKGDDKLLIKGRARYWRLKAARAGDPLVNALFGRSA